MTDPVHNSWTIARSALLTHQKRLSVTANNIANIDTPGYHRKIVRLETTPETPVSLDETRTWSKGTGVRVADVVRAYNETAHAMLRQQGADVAGHQARADALRGLESLMREDGELSLGALLDAFWGAWHDVANQADNNGFRSVAIQRGVELAAHIRSLNSRIDLFEQQIVSGVPGSYSGTLANDVAQFNRLTEELRDLNERIRYSSFFEPHALLDRRDLLLQELSEYAGLSITADGQVELGGETVVSADGSTRAELRLEDIGFPPAFSLDDGVNPPANVLIESGRIGAGSDVLGISESLRERLDILAADLADAVNAIHNSTHPESLGPSYDLNGTFCDWDFFVGGLDPADPVTAATISVHTLLYDPANPMSMAPDRLAAAATRYDEGPPPVPNPGDGARALQIAELASASRLALDGQGFGAFHTTGLSLLGGIIGTEQALADDGKAIVDALKDILQAETGVNLDEELMNMVLAQRAFQAAGRLLQTVDEMMLTILQL